MLPPAFSRRLLIRRMRGFSSRSFHWLLIVPIWAFRTPHKAANPRLVEIGRPIGQDARRHASNLPLSLTGERQTCCSG